MPSTLFTRDPATLLAALPAGARARLLTGSCGMLQLAEIAGLILAAPHNDILGAVCADMLLSALGESPLNGELAGRMLALPGLSELLGPERRDLLRAVAEAWKRPANDGYLRKLMARREMDKLRSYLAARMEAEPENLFWREQATILAMAEGDAEFAALALGGDALRTPAPVRAAARWQLLFLTGRLDEAARLAEDMEPLYGPGCARARAAEAALAGGGREEGLGLLLEALAAAPWRVNELLRAHELLEGEDRAVAPMRGAVRILLYTWNKAEDLDATLGALVRSDLGLARVVALNNGSTDRTAQVLGKWQAELGRERLRIVELPVNIGAPAARNWLLHAEAGDADWLVYLDDDALVPPDWLGRFGAAVRRLPEAGVWGCRVVDDAQPLLCQAVDYHFNPPLPDAAAANVPDLASLQPHPFKLSRLHLQGPDRGQFDYVRPCASVTGCCHLFRRERLEETGDFSLFLSPSQYDDVERDLRMLAGGRLAGYQGHLRVRHRKRSGRSSLLSETENANALGNRYKMQILHDAGEIAASVRADQEALDEDFAARLERVRAALPRG